MKRLVTALFLTLSACGAPQEQAATPGAGTSAPRATTDQQRLTNLGHFDVGSLDVAPPAVTGPVSGQVLLGVELAARPLAMECLVDPKNRGADKRTHVIVDATLGAGGVDHKVSGENLTSAGVACITGALGRWTQAAQGLRADTATPSKPGAPITAHLEFEHLVGVNPSVTFGVNDASDVVGAIRLALPGFADCFADWKSALPRPLRATVKVARPAAAAATVTPADVTFEPAGDPTADKVAACLKGKIMALPLKPPASEALTVPYAMRFVHSGVAGELPGATPDLQFTQLDLQRARRAAEVAIAFGGRGVSAEAYDAAVKSYKANAKSVSVQELRDKCAALLAADDRVLDALGKQVTVEEATHRFALDQKAKDPAWADAESAAARKLDEARKDVASFQGNRKADESACPKTVK